MELEHRYQLDRVIGVGATAEIWRGYDRLLQRPVAVRLLRSDRPSRRDAFLAAGRAAARFTHPNITAVYDVGVAELPGRGPTPFVVMELAEGPSLAAELRSGRPAWQDVVRIGAGVAAALADAHREWIAHGRLGPDKMLLTAVGVKVLGFGVDLSGDFDVARGDVRALRGVLATCLGDEELRRLPAVVRPRPEPEGYEGPDVDEIAAALARLAEATVEVPAALSPRGAAVPVGAGRRRTRWTLRTVVAMSSAAVLLLGGVAALGQAAPGGLSWFGHRPETAAVPPDNDPCAGAAAGSRGCTLAEAPPRPAPTTAIDPTPSRPRTAQPSADSPVPVPSATPSRSRSASPSASASPSGSPSPTSSPSASPSGASPSPAASSSAPTSAAPSRSDQLPAAATL